MTFDTEQRKIYHARLMYARPFIDSLDFANNGQEIGGEVPVAELPRLQDVLENPQGVLQYRVSGGVDNLGSHFLDISVIGQCQLRCQRCLSGMDYPINLATRLLLRDQASLDGQGTQELTDEADEPDSILAEAQLDVLNLLEDEILLSLPFSPKHPTGVCQVTGGENRPHQQAQEAPKAPHPFATLAQLKRN